MNEYRQCTETYRMIFELCNKYEKLINSGSEDLHAELSRDIELITNSLPHAKPNLGPYSVLTREVRLHFSIIYDYKIRASKYGKNIWGGMLYPLLSLRAELLKLFPEWDSNYKKNKKEISILV